jgi:tetratricopeptide (TPR) repeat protein
MAKLFISYRSLDAAKVDTLVARLQALKHDTWQDKHNIPAGADWWGAIVSAIGACEVFVFMLSQAALESAICRAELNYAAKRNRPILPIVLAGEHSYDIASGRQTSPLLQQLPPELTDARLNLLFDMGAATYGEIEKALAHFRSQPDRWRDLHAPVPLDPRQTAASDHISLYQEACEFAMRAEYDTARQRFQRLVQAGSDLFADDASAWIDIIGRYQEIVRLDNNQITRRHAATAWQVYRSRFPQPFIELYDPHNLAANYDSQVTTHSNMTASEWFEKGLEAEQEGNIDDQIRFYSETIRLDPEYGTAYNNRGNAYHRKKEYQRAITDYNQAIFLNPQYAAFPYNNRGTVYFDMGDYDRAIADYSQAIQLDDTDAITHYNRGEAYEYKGDRERALADYQTALSLQPDHPETLAALQRLQGG